MTPAIRSRCRVLAVTAVAVVASIVALAPPSAMGAPARTTDVTDALVTIYTKLGYQGSAAAGTGIVIDASGLVLTNNHVIRGATTLRAIDVGNGRSYRATVLGYSVASDVALLQLQNASGLEAAKTGGAVRVGAAVTAYGNGGGDGIEEVGSSGKVRGVGRSITASDGQGSGERLTHLIQSDVSLEPGDSGGPLVDSNGRVVGMNTAASAGFRFGSGQTSTQAFTIPIARALAIATRIQQGQTSATVHVGPSAMLGVSVESSDFSGFGGLSTAGAVVASVLPGSPAAKAGISAGSLITALGAKRITSPEDLSRAMLGHVPKETVAITWLDELGNRTQASTRLVNGPPQ